MKIKYIFALLLAAILMSFTAMAEEEFMFKVGLFYGSSAKEQIAVSSEVRIATELDEDLGQKVVASVSEGNVVLHNPEGDTLLYSGENGNEIKIVADDKILDIGGKKYRGNVILKPEGDKLTVINEVGVDDYVKGVVAREMPSSWHIEALKAQAVAARCFGFTAMGKHGDMGFDLCDNTNCQVYGGIAAETEATNKAVEETAGVVVTYNGKIINTLFSSSNGGYVEASENVWGGSYPYFKTFKDEYEKTEEISGGVWEVEFTPEEIKSELLFNQVDIGDIVGMEVVKTSSSGRVLEVKITGTKGTKSYTKSYARTFLSLRSQLYTITQPTGNSVYVLGENGKEKVTGKYYALTAEGLKEFSNSSGSDKYIISGRGYGHGVGMSQWGANHMSQQGLTYEDILTYYYKGCTLTDYSEIMS